MDKSYLDGVPSEGEFVRWLKEKEYKFEEQALYKTHEYGLYSEWDKLPKLKCRPFNSIRFEGNKFYKTAIDRQGRELAVREVAWYKKLQDKDFKNIPKIYNYNPLCMERIDGKNIYEYTDLPFEKKKEILKQITSCLEHIHGLGSIKTDEASYKEAYIGKTYARLEKVKELVPFAKDSTININGRECRNIFFHKKETEDLVMQYIPERFSLIHGDCTFSNIMLENNTIPKLIDPRGYFGTTELYGDAAYDWVKLYYSIVSNYDQFNLKRFGLYMDGYKVKLEINSKYNYNNRNNNYNDRNNNSYNNKKNFGNDQRNSNFNRRDNNENNRNGQRKPNDKGGIEKKIKNIMDADIPMEKDNIIRDFGNKAKDKAKQNRQDDQKNRKN